MKLYTPSSKHVHAGHSQVNKPVNPSPCYFCRTRKRCIRNTDRGPEYVQESTCSHGLHLPTPIIFACDRSELYKPSKTRSLPQSTSLSESVQTASQDQRATLPRRAPSSQPSTPPSSTSPPPLPWPPPTTRPTRPQPTHPKSPPNTDHPSPSHKTPSSRPGTHYSKNTRTPH